MLTVKKIRNLCSSGVYAGGLEICKPGNIRKVNLEWLDDHTVKAKALVRGNFGYYHNVRLVLDSSKPNTLDADNCDCYEKTQIKTPCRHCIALALALASDGNRELGYTLEPAGADFAPQPWDEIVKTEKQQIEHLRADDAIPSEPEKESVEPVIVPAAEPNGMEIRFGTLPDQDDEPMLWYPNDTSRVFHTNTGVIGTMGTGKTQFTKALITQLYRQQKNNFYGTPLGILIFDYKGDYKDQNSDFVKACNARVLSISKLPFNPLALHWGKDHYKPQLPVHTAKSFTDTIGRAYNLGIKQRNSLFGCIMRAYRNSGIEADDPKTWMKRAPTFDMVYDIYEKDREIPKNDSLEAAMLDLHTFNIFETNPYYTKSLYDLLKGVVVIDLTEAFSEQIQSLIVGITLDQFYTQMRINGFSATNGKLRELTKFILVDEADVFMRRGFPALKRIMKEGREFGVGTILSSQSLDHFDSGEDDYSKYIMTWVVHNVSDLKRSNVEYVFRYGANSTDTERLFNDIKNTDRFHSIVKIGNADPIHVRDSVFFEMMREESQT